MRLETLALALTCALLVSCSNDRTTGVTGPPVTVNSPVTTQTAVVGDAFTYDATQGGTAFDSEGSQLTYTVTFAPRANGFTSNLGTISGTPLAVETTFATITASNAGGRSASQTFSIVVLTNAPITVLSSSSPQPAVVGTPFSYDATQAGAAFSDPRGTGLVYSAVFQSSPNGLSATHGTVTGTPTAPGTVRILFSATDATGRSASTLLHIVAFSADLVAPVLPAVLHPYSDQSVPTPAHFGLITAGGQTAFLADNTPPSNITTDAGATLGRVLFYDRRLSVNDRVSCASCHLQQFAFGDTARLSRGFASGLTNRHSLALANARYYKRGRFFWDERAPTLEALALLPIQDPIEMGMNIQDLVPKLAATSYYAALFQAAFGSADITTDRVARAISQFVRSLVSAGSRFDQIFTPEGPVPDGILTELEQTGRSIFNSRGCAQCHGTTLQISDDVHNNGLDLITTDVGAGSGRFKAPSLRNVGLRAPYMHDGRFATLEEVIDFYNDGIQPNPDLSARLQGAGGPVRFNLTTQDKSGLAAFLRALTDEEFTTAPRFSNPFPK